MAKLSVARTTAAKETSPASPSPRAPQVAGGPIGVPRAEAQFSGEKPRATAALSCADNEVSSVRKLPLPGRRLIAGRYLLVQPVVDGRSDLWIAEHRMHCATVVVRLGEQGPMDAAPRERFRRHASAAERVRSPHLVELYDHGIDASSTYVVMQHLEGEDLAQRLDRLGKLSATKTSELIAQLSRGLARLHASKLIHGDVRPEKVFFVPGASAAGEQETIKLLPAATAGDAARAGMAPEQGRGRVDHRADLWALGALAYRCLTGAADVLERAAAGTLPAPSEANPELAAFDAWCARALAVDPAKRFSCARALSEAFVEALQVHSHRAARLREAPVEKPAIRRPPGGFSAPPPPPPRPTPPRRVSVAAPAPMPVAVPVTGTAPVAATATVAAPAPVVAPAPVTAPEPVPVAATVAATVAEGAPEPPAAAPEPAIEAARESATEVDLAPPSQAPAARPSQDDAPVEVYVDDGGPASVRVDTLPPPPPRQAAVARARSTARPIAVRSGAVRPAQPAAMPGWRHAARALRAHPAFAAAMLGCGVLLGGLLARTLPASSSDPSAPTVIQPATPSHETRAVQPASTPVSIEASGFVGPAEEAPVQPVVPARAPARASADDPWIVVPNAPR
jgi:serine/threonine-protein kinase